METSDSVMFITYLLSTDSYPLKLSSKTDSHSSNTSSLQIAILEIITCNQEREGREHLTHASAFNYFTREVILIFLSKYKDHVAFLCP